MPWPLAVSNGQQTDASQYNNLLASAQTWPTNVSANSNALTNVTALSAPAAAALTITATSVSFLSPDATHNVQLTVGNTGTPSLTSTASALLTTSTLTIQNTNGIAVLSPDGTRSGRFACANAGDPTITTGTGNISLGGLVKVSNQMQVYATNMASGIYYNFAFATQNAVPTCHTLSAVGAAGILYIASPVTMLAAFVASASATFNSTLTASSLSVTGSTTLAGLTATTLGVTGATSAAALTASGLVTANSGLTVSGSATFSGAVAHTANTVTNAVSYTDGTNAAREYYDASHVWHIDSGTSGAPVNALGISPAGGVTCYQTLAVTGVTNFNSNVAVNAAMAVNAGFNFLVGNAGNTQSVVLGFQGNANPTLTSTTGAVDSTSSLRFLNAVGAVFFNSGNAQSMSIGFNGAQPTINSTTGNVTIPCNLTVTPTANPVATFNLPGGAGTNSWVLITQPGTSVSMNIGVSNNINGGTQPYLFSGTQLNISAPILYVTGSISATAHNTHASGSDLADIHKAFYRREEEVNEFGAMTEHVIRPDSWTLAPADDGLHILVKRSMAEVVEFVLPWEQAKPVALPEQALPKAN